MKKTNKTMKRVVAGCLLVGILASVGIGAYLTSTETKTDVYTVGNVQAEIVSRFDLEEDWTNGGILRVLPNTVLPYERAAMNTGINDAYVFMTVTIPVMDAYKSDDDGTNSGGKYFMQCFAPEEISSEWKLVDAGILGMNSIWSADMVDLEYAHDTHFVVNSSTDGYDFASVTYIYGYVGDNADGSLKALAPGETTANLFSELKVANFSNYRSYVDINGHTVINKDNGLLGKGHISTNLYAIQSGNVNGGLTDVNGVWAVVNNAINGFEKIDLVIEDGTATIAMGAYMQRADIKSVTIPASVTKIDEGAFFECINLKTINFEGTEEQWNAITFGDMWNYGVPADVVINFFGEEKVEVNLDEVIPEKYAGSYTLTDPASPSIVFLYNSEYDVYIAFEYHDGTYTYVSFLTSDIVGDSIEEYCSIWGQECIVVEADINAKTLTIIN